MSAIHVFSALLFLLSAGLLVLAERLKDRSESLSRKAAVASLAAVFGAGVLFVMDVPQIGGLMDPWTHAKKKQKTPGKGMDEDDEATEAEKPPAEQVAESQMDEGNVGANLPECEGCPSFVDIPPGKSQIGADANEPTATRAEKPGKMITIWPGFAISQRPVSKTQYKRFIEATQRKMTMCPEQAGAPVLTKIEDPSIAPATCVSYEDAAAFAAWMSARTGKTYRLPTAAQWEFVARNAIEPGSPEAKARRKPSEPRRWIVGGMKTGVAELVGDCWAEKLEFVEDAAAKSKRPTCQHRMLKGAVEGEEERWQQPWSRRPIPAMAQSLEVGFRIVRLN